MTVDPGRPFSKSFRILIEAMEERIRQGVEVPASISKYYQSEQTTYPLPQNVYAVTDVGALRGGIYTKFSPGVHFRLNNYLLVWTHATETPDEGALMTINYTYRERPAGLTDFNPGSVVGTMIRAVSHEMKLLYDQIDEAYRRAFIDQAQGVALDNVVALMGIARNTARFAEGSVTFFVESTPSSDIVVPSNIRVADESGREFVTQKSGTISINTTDTVPLTDYKARVNNRIGEVTGVWRTSDDPETDPPLPLATLPDDAPPFGEDERTLTLDNSVDAGILQVQVHYTARSVTVPVQASVAGPDGNVNAGAVVVMPTPPPNIDGVINEEAVIGGLDPEPDEQLRERTKFELERAGNSTLSALKYAVLDIDGVEAVEVLDHSSDPTIPLGIVQLRYGGQRVDLSEVLRVIDDTRAAGISVEVDAMKIVSIAGVFYLLPDAQRAEGDLARFKNAVMNAFAGMTAGQTLSLRRINALIYNIVGLVEVADAQLTYTDESAEVPTPVDLPDPFVIRRDQLLQVDPAQILIRVVQAINVETKVDNSGVTLQFRDGQNQGVKFNRFNVTVNVQLWAELVNIAGEYEQVGNFDHDLSFNNQTNISINISKANAPQFREPGDSNPHIATGVRVIIGMPAYAGILSVTTEIDLS